MSLPVQSQRLQIMAYYGYGSPSLVSLTGRVLVDPGLRHSGEARSALKNLANMARRFESDEIPYAVVRAQLAGVSQEVVADAEGYFTVTLVPPEPLPLNRLWHAIELTLFQPQLPNTEPVQAIGQILVPLPGARFGIISDIDDTVIQRHITRRLRMVLTLLLRNPQQRMPMPGISALYHAAPAPAVNPIFYVSNSPWNLYDLLIRIFVQRDIPAGPLFLRDWGVSKQARSIRRKHKPAAIRQILARFPDIVFLLLGDSGERDPEIYLETVQRYPGRILATYIRQVNLTAKRMAQIDTLVQAAAAAGSEFILVEDSLAIARHAAARGWIQPAAVATIAAAQAGIVPGKHSTGSAHS